MSARALKAGAIAGPLPRRDLIAICAFLRNPSGVKSVDGCHRPESHLDRLAAAARMQ